MLETPTVGRFHKEERFLVFEPPREYLLLVYGCIVGGALGFLYGFTMHIFWWQMFGGMVCLAGLWANISLIRIRFDIKNRTYRRRQGKGIIPTLWQGSFDQFDAIVVLAEPSITAPGVVKYHMVLHWKPGKAPLMVLESEVRMAGGDLRYGAQSMLAKANMVATSLRIPLYDNSHFPSPCPVAIF